MGLYYEFQMSEPVTRYWLCPNIRVTRGKVGSQYFAFSSADTKSFGISGLPDQKKAVLTLKILPFSDSAKSKRVVSSPTGNYTVKFGPSWSQRWAWLQEISKIRRFATGPYSDNVRFLTATITEAGLRHIGC